MAAIPVQALEAADARVISFTDDDETGIDWTAQIVYRGRVGWVHGDPSISMLGTLSVAYDDDDDVAPSLYQDRLRAIGETLVERMVSAPQRPGYRTKLTIVS